jgi:phage gp46-like protein
MSVSLNIVERLKAEPNYLWDTVFDGFVGDWAPEKATAGDFSNDFSDDFGGAPVNPTGGLRARAPLHTAILLCLMSDRRAEPNDFIPDGSGDPRGWAGDAIDPDLAPLGSRLWQLRRRELTQEIAELSIVFAHEALQTLIDQNAVAEFKIAATPNYELGRLEMTVDGFRESGQRAASVNFALLWKASLGVPKPLQV